MLTKIYFKLSQKVAYNLNNKDWYLYILSIDTSTIIIGLKFCSNNIYHMYKLNMKFITLYM